MGQIPKLPPWVWGVMLIGIGACEAQRIAVGFSPLDKETSKAPSALKPEYVAGDLGFDPLNLMPEDPAELKIMQEKELAHARLRRLSRTGGRHQGHMGHRLWRPRFLSAHV